MKNILIAICLLILLSCGQKNSNSNNELDQRKELIQKIEQVETTKDQLERKKSSLEICKNWKIPTSEALPVIQSSESTKIRNLKEIVDRALVLGYLGLKSEGVETKHLNEYEAKYSIQGSFSPSEINYKTSGNPTEQQTTNANWRYESLHVLLWSLGYIDSLVAPTEMCNVAHDMKLILANTKEDFIKNAKLRSKDEILNQADLIYRINWTCVDARINNRQAPAKLNSSVVYERHYALNWLIKYANQQWDEISTDT